MKKTLIIFILSTITYFAYTQTAKQVVENFISSIGKQDFKSAYTLQNIPAWGSFEKFSSIKAFGGIYKTEIITIEQKPDDKGNSVVFVDAVYYDSINGSKEFEENFYLSNSTGALKIVKLKVLKTLNPMLKKITDADFKAYVASYKETNFPVDLAKCVGLEGARKIPEKYIKKIIDKEYIAGKDDEIGASSFYYSFALFTTQYIAVLYINACEMCEGKNQDFQTLYLNTYTYAGIPISKFEIGRNSSIAEVSFNVGTVRKNYQMSGKINLNTISKVLITEYVDEIKKKTSEGKKFKIQPNGQVIENPNDKIDNFPIEFIKQASIERKLHYQFSSIELNKLKYIDAAFFTKWLNKLPASTYLGAESLEWKEFEAYQFFDFKELNDKILFSIISTDEGSYNTLIHYTFDKGKGKIVQVFKSGITENDDPGHHTFLDYNKTGDILKQTVISRENDTIGIEKFEFNLQATKYSKIDASSKLGATFVDSRDGYVYKTVTIGSQTWLAENLAYKASGTFWAYDDQESNVAEYGYLYDWETAKTACPSGWLLPSKTDFETLLNNVGGNGPVAFQALIPSGSSGFSARFGGFRNVYSFFYNIGEGANFWSSSTSNEAYAWDMYIYFDGKRADVDGGWAQSSGFSVRCLQNN